MRPFGRRLALPPHLAELALALAIVGVAWSARRFGRAPLIKLPPRLHEARLPRRPPVG